MSELLDETAERLGAISPTACGAKWFQTTLHLFNGNTQSCHHVKSHRVPLKELKKTPASLHNSRTKMAVRSQMLKGRQVDECRYCWDIEKVGGVSDRQIKSSAGWSFPLLKKDVFESQVARAVPTYLEVAFDNVCNLKCIYCSPVYSSSWHKEVVEFGAYPTSRRFNNLQQFKIDRMAPLEKEKAQVYRDTFWKWWPQLKTKLHHLRVTGGEPLLSPDLWKLLNALKAEKFPDLIFSINSNMMTPTPTFKRFCDDLGQIQKNITKVILFCSIDSVGAQAEYLRNGLNEKLFYENLELLLSGSERPMHVSFMITVSALSLSGLADLFLKISALKKKYPRHEIDFDTPYLRNPAHLSVLVLPSRFEKYLDRALDVLRREGFSEVHQQKIMRIKSFWRENGYKGVTRFRLRRDFKIMLKEHDRRRKTDFKSTFPEYRLFDETIFNPFWRR